MKNIKFKRIIAYFLDILLVSLIVYGLSSLNFLNPGKEEYANKYTEYQEYYEQYQNNVISEETYKNIYIEYNYELAKYDISYMIINIVVLISYFGVFQFLLKGQTLGKRIMNIKIVNYKDKKLTIFNYIIRTLILNSIIFIIVKLIALLVLNAKGYYYTCYYMAQLDYVIQVLILIMIFLDKENRGLHDKIANTKVIECKNS